MGKYQAEQFGYAKGQADLVLRKDGKWFLLVTVDVPDGTKTPPTDFIGVDLGVINIAVDRDGENHSSKPIETKRVQYAKARTRQGDRGSQAEQAAALPQGDRRTKKREARFAGTSITRSARNSLRRPKTPAVASPSKISKASAIGLGFAGRNGPG